MLVKGHCGGGSRWGRDVPESNVSKDHKRTGLKEDEQDFCQIRIHSIIQLTKEKIRRPQAKTLKVQRPKEEVNIDSVCMGHSNETDLKYVLVIKDELS